MRNLKTRIKNVILTGAMAAAVVTASSCNPVTKQEATVESETSSEAETETVLESSSEAEPEDMTEGTDRVLLEDAEQILG